MIEFWGMLAPQVQIIRSNQSSPQQKQEAVEYCYALAHSQAPEELPALWELLTELSEMSGDM